MPVETAERINPSPHLTPEDQVWLASFGVDPTWQEDASVKQELDTLIDVGSTDLRGYTGDFNAVIEARAKFLAFAGVKDETIDGLRVGNPHLVPVSTFIGSQRVLAGSGINGASIVEALPAVIALTADNVKEKIDNLRDLNIDPAHSISLQPSILRQSTENIQSNVAALQEAGLDVGRIANSLPAVICYAPESLRVKIASLKELGLNPAKVINAHASVLASTPEAVKGRIDYLNGLGVDAIKAFNKQPTALTLPVETLTAKVENMQQLGLNPARIINLNPSAIGNSVDNVNEKFDNLRQLGLDPIKVLNGQPTTLGLSTDTVQSKFNYLTSLGLNAVTVINNQPALLGYSEETLASKMRLLEHTVRLLKWDFTAQDLVNRIPKMLGTSSQKISILRRIAAEYGERSDRSMTPDEMLYPMITPLEKVIIELAENPDDKPRSIDSINRKAASHKLTAPERREKALEIARSGVLGRIGTMYLKYRGEDAQDE